MKFEKFFKATGTHGLIVEKSENNRWLLCGGVGMKIPSGVTNLGMKSDATNLFDAIIHSNSEDDTLTLVKAVINDPEGKANDIIRVFETEIGDKICIYNNPYGLLERKDRLTYLEIEAENENDPGEKKVFKYIVVRDRANEPIGFIAGCDEI